MEAREIGSVLRHPAAGSQIAAAVASFPYLQAREGWGRSLVWWGGACPWVGLPRQSVQRCIRCAHAALQQSPLAVERISSGSLATRGAFPHLCLQLEAQLHPITRTVLRIQLTITPAFTWKEG